MDDLIKRSDMIDELMHIIPYKRYHNGEYVFLLDKRKCLKAIKTVPTADIPSVDKEYLMKLIQEAVYDGESCVKLLNLVDKPQGEWIEHKWAEEVEGLLISNYECSECHNWERRASDYCPNCGTKMKGVDGDL